MRDTETAAADGGRVPGACNTLAEFIRSLEDGQFDADCYEALKDLAATLCDVAFQAGGKAKAKFTITLDFVQEGGVTAIKSAFKSSLPPDVRAKSILFLTPDNRFTRVRPGQHELFGIRDVSSSAQPLRDSDHAPAVRDA